MPETGLTSGVERAYLQSRRCFRDLEENIMSYMLHEQGQLNERNCPRCEGTGKHADDVDGKCAYCVGRSFVTQEMLMSYVAEDFENVPCPHCHETGETGMVTFGPCGLCEGETEVKRYVAEAYVPPPTRFSRPDEY
jgi:DnaJ-class molecular chaperone